MRNCVSITPVPVGETRAARQTNYSLYELSPGADHAASGPRRRPARPNMTVTHARRERAAHRRREQIARRAARPACGDPRGGGLAVGRRTRDTGPAGSVRARRLRGARPPRSTPTRLVVSSAAGAPMEACAALPPHDLPMAELADIAGRYDTDKAGHTHYLRNYEEHFAPLRDREVRLLELGVKEGGSLLMWR